MPTCNPKPGRGTRGPTAGRHASAGPSRERTPRRSSTTKQTSLRGQRPSEFSTQVLQEADFAAGSRDGDSGQRPTRPGHRRHERGDQRLRAGHAPELAGQHRFAVVGGGERRCIGAVIADLGGAGRGISAFAVGMTSNPTILGDKHGDTPAIRRFIARNAGTPTRIAWACTRFAGASRRFVRASTGLAGTSGRFTETSSRIAGTSRRFTRA